MGDDKVIIAVLFIGACVLLYGSIVLKEQIKHSRYTRAAYFVIALLATGTGVYYLKYWGLGIDVPMDLVNFQLLVIAVYAALYYIAVGARRCIRYREDRIWNSDTIYDPKGIIDARIKEDSVMSKPMKRRSDVE